MAGIDENIKHEFRKAGQHVWKWYCDRYSALKNEGVKLAVARHQAIQETVEQFDVKLSPPGTPAPDAPGLMAPARVSGRVKAKEFGTRSCSLADSVLWVSEFLQIADVKAKDAPSKTAWSILTWARRSALNESEFFKGLLSKLLPTKAETEELGRFKDDGQPIRDAIQVLQGKTTPEQRVSAGPVFGG